MSTKTTSKSRYFLVELIVNCMFFVICASVCINLFSEGYIKSNESRVLSMATLQAQNTAECFKASEGNLDVLAQLVKGRVENQAVIIYFDEEWRAIEEMDSPFHLVLESKEVQGMKTAEIIVYKGDELQYELTVQQYSGIEGGVLHE